MQEKTVIWHAWNFELPSGSQAFLLWFWKLRHMVQLQPPQSIKIRKSKHMYVNNSYYLHLADGCVILHCRWKNLNFILKQIHKSERNKMPRLLEQVQTIKTTNQPPTKPFSWAFVALIPATITTNPGKQLTLSRIWIWKESQRFQLQTCSTKKHVPSCFMPGSFYAFLHNCMWMSLNFLNIILTLLLVLRRTSILMKVYSSFALVVLLWDVTSTSGVGNPF